MTTYQPARAPSGCGRAFARPFTATNLLTMALLLALAGCAAQGVSPMGPAPVASTVRDQIGRLAIRGPSTPAVTLTAEVDNKGEAAGKTAKTAGFGWLGGSLQAAGESGDPLSASLIAAFGIITAPVVAAGGAIYGASAADSDDTVVAGNSVLLRTLDFAPDQFRLALETAFVDTVPVEHAFVPTQVADADLKSQGFDSVLDVHMDTIVSRTSANQIEVTFELHNSVTLTSLEDGQVLARRSYDGLSTDRNVSEWARDDGRTLRAEVAQRFAEMSGAIADQFFAAPAIRVAGLEPVTRRHFGIGEISGTVPLFVWSALDGGGGMSRTDVEYEISIDPKGREPATSARTATTRYVPPEPLQACQRYQWKVRAHYLSFEREVASDWSPTYRFKTPCN